MRNSCDEKDRIYTAGINFSVLRLAIKIVWNGSLAADNDTKIMSNFYNSNLPPW